jgi:hypothetical protein
MLIGSLGASLLLYLSHAVLRSLSIMPAARTTEQGKRGIDGNGWVIVSWRVV